MTQTTARPGPVAADLVRPRTIFVDGEWRPSKHSHAISVNDPATEQPLTTIAAASATDVDAAVAAAVRAFPRWAATPLEERLAVLERFGELLARDADAIADLLTAETGMPRTLTGAVQLPFAADVVRSYLELAPQYPWRSRIGHSTVLQEPAGVVVCITPWNAPLVLVLQKLVPALAAGCTVVLKPSELAPLNTCRIVDLLAEAGLPAGVVGLVCGTGRDVGETLAGHPDVSVVSLTGSLRAGRRVTELGASRAARVCLELGGKSASLVLPDADVLTAVAATVDQVMFNSGQACFAWSRLLVPADRYEEAVELAGTVAAAMSVGDPWDPATRLGPVITEAARQRILGMIAAAVADGARLVTGGEAAPLSRGHFIQPTVLADVAPDAAVVREEIFGPVVTVLPYTDEDDGVRLANDTDYGLHGAVWSADVPRAFAVASRLRTGRVDVNGSPFNLRAPFGGYKRSGTGRELGRWGLDAFCETKSVQLPPEAGDVQPAIQIRSGSS
jgi:aldehyde dehydrogenase (NAD+)